MRSENQKMKNGKFYNPKIFRSDCFEYLKVFRSKFYSAHSHFPPYNIGKEYEDKKSFQKYLIDQEKVLRQCYRILKAKGSLCWQVGTFVDKNEIIPLVYRYLIFAKNWI